MASFPHEYRISTSGGPEGVLPVESPGLPTLKTHAPAEFGGPGDYWSPETMLTGAVANCLILTFRALARGQGLEWSNLEVNCTGTVDRTRDGLKFTKFDIDAVLMIGATADEAKARQVLESAKKHCLVTASLAAETHMKAKVSKT
jgi:uncharacterized OsmC-like protein